MSLKKVPVVIVGGGIAGMSAAHCLAKEGRDFLLLEQSEKLGGVIATKKGGPYFLETGPFSFLPKAKLIFEMAQELGLQEEIVEAKESAAKNRFILKKQKLYRLPLTAKDFLFSSLLSPWAKLRFLLEPFAKKPPLEEETIAAFVKRRAGQAVLDNMIGPFVSGVVAGDPYRLSLSAQFPIFATLEKEYGSLLRAFQRRKKENRPKQTLFSFKEGMESLPKAFLKKYGSQVRCNTTVLEIKSILQNHPVILTTPAYVSAKLLRPFSEVLFQELASIYYAPIVLVHAAYSRNQIGHPLNGFGFLSAAGETHPLLGSIWASSVFEGRSPKEDVLLTFYFGGAKYPEAINWPDEKYLEVIQKIANPVLKISGDCKKYWIQKHEKAIPQYFLGHQKKIETIEKETSKIKGLHLVGNYFSGVSLDEAASHAKKIAQSMRRPQ